MPLKDKEQRKAYDAARYRANRERLLAQAAAYYRQNREAVLARVAANPRRQPEPAEALRVRVARRKARKLAAFVENVHPLVLLERDDGACGICGEDVDPFCFHMDHIRPLAKGGKHSYANTQLAHPKCNLQKGARYDS